MVALQACAVAPSSEHTYLPPVPAPEAVKLAVCWLVRLGGPPLRPVSGGTVSTVQLTVATEETLPAKSVTFTEYVCRPSVRPVTETPLWHAEKAAALSSLHAADCTPEVASNPDQVNLALVWFVIEAGPD